MKLLTCVLLALLLVSQPVAMAEADEEMGILYTYIASIRATLSISAGGTASCSGGITPLSSSTTSSVTVQLKRGSGSTWTTIATWSDSGQGLAGASASGTKAVTSGYSYKVVTTGTIRDLDGNVLETATKTTAVQDY